MGSKREIVSDLPEKHVEVDNMDTAFASLKSAIDKKENQKIFSAISNIIKQYKEDYNKELTDRNKYLVRYIYQNEKQFLESFINNEENFKDLKDRIQEKINEEISEDNDGIPLSKALSEISESVRKAIISLIKEKDSKTSTTEEKIQFSKKQLTDFAKEAFKSELVKDVQKLMVDDFNKKYVNKSRQIYIDKLKEFKTNVSKIQTQTSNQLKAKKHTRTNINRSQNQTTKTKIVNRNQKKPNLIEKNLKQGSVELLPYEKSMGKKLSDRILRRFTDIKKRANKRSKMDGLLRGLFKIGKFLKLLGIGISKVFGTALKFVVKGICGTIKGAFKFIGWIKNKVVMKLFGFVGNLFKHIVLSPLSKGFFNVLFTPVGMFALGYFSAWIWDKIKGMLPDVKDWFGDKKNDFNETVEWITGTIADITDTVTSLIDDITTIAKRFTTGIWEKIKTGVDFLQPFFDFITPGFFGFLTGTILTTIIKVRSNPLFKAIRPLKGMPFFIGLGAVLLINALSAIFKSRNEEGTQYTKGAICDYGKISESQSDENKNAINSLGEKEHSKLQNAMSEMDKEVAKIQELNDTLEFLEKTEKDGQEFNSSESQFNLYQEFPGLFSDVYNSKVFGNSKIPDGLDKSRSAYQIQTLANHLSLRMQKLNVLKTALYSSKNVNEIEKILGKFNFNETKGSDGETEYNLNGVTEDLNEALSKSAHNIVVGENMGKRMMDTRGRGKYEADIIEKRDTGYESEKLLKSLKTEDTLNMSNGEKEDYIQFQTDQNGNQEKFNSKWFLNDQDKSVQDKLTFVKEGQIANIDKIKQVMGYKDVIRFKKASSTQEKNQIIDEFIKKYEEREQNIRKNKVDELKRRIQEIKSKIEEKNTFLGGIKTDLLELKEKSKEFVDGARTGYKVASTFT